MPVLVVSVSSKTFEASLSNLSCKLAPAVLFSLCCVLQGFPAALHPSHSPTDAVGNKTSQTTRQYTTLHPQPQCKKSDLQHAKQDHNSSSLPTACQHDMHATLHDFQHDSKHLLRVAAETVQQSCQEDWLLQPYIPDLQVALSSCIWQ